MTAELKPCPFCGHVSPYFERMGTPRWSCIVICTDCGARHESSDEDERSGWSWNQRAALAQPEQPTCPHIRSSGTGGWATNWCELNGPPAAQPSDAELERRTGEPHVDGWPLYSGLPPAEAVTVTDGMVLDAVRACVNAAKRGESAEEQMRAAIAAALAAKEASRD